MADSENSRTLPKISCANAFPNETFVDNLPSVINRRNLLPLAARILPMLLNDLPSRTIAGPVHAKELWPDWYDMYQQRLAAERECRELEARLLEETGGRPAVVIAVNDDGPSCATGRSIGRRVPIRQLCSAGRGSFHLVFRRRPQVRRIAWSRRRSQATRNCRRWQRNCRMTWRKQSPMVMKVAAA